jgi:hypothetical protein
MNTTWTKVLREARRVAEGDRGVYVRSSADGWDEVTTTDGRRAHWMRVCAAGWPVGDHPAWECGDDPRPLPQWRGVIPSGESRLWWETLRNMRALARPAIEAEKEVLRAAGRLAKARKTCAEGSPAMLAAVEDLAVEERAACRLRPTLSPAGWRRRDAGSGGAIIAPDYLADAARWLSLVAFSDDIVECSYWGDEVPIRLYFGAPGWREALVLIMPMREVGGAK